MSAWQLSKKNTVCKGWERVIFILNTDNLIGAQNPFVFATLSSTRVLISLRG